MFFNHYFHMNIDYTIAALVGMGAFLTGVARTPITAVVIVFEMTGDYNHILPMMLCAAIADLITEKLKQPPIYSALIYQQKMESKDAELLSKISVKEAMHIKVDSLSKSLTIDETYKIIKETKHETYPVREGRKKLVGIIKQSDIDNAYLYGISKDTELEKLMDPHPITINIEENLYIASFLLHSHNIASLIAVDKRNNIKGIITRSDINNTLEKLH